MTYFKRVFIAFDQLVGTIFGGYPDCTISAQCWLWHIHGKHEWAYRLVNAMFFWQSNHCRGAYNDEMARKQCPQEMR